MQKDSNIGSKGYFLLAFILISICWQLGSTAIAILVLLISKIIEIRTSRLLLTGVLILISTLLLDIYYSDRENSITSFFINGLYRNITFLQLITKNDLSLALYYQLKVNGEYLLGTSVLIAGLIQLINNFHSSPHSEILKKMSQGKLESLYKPVNHRRLEKKLTRLKDEDYDGILLGISHTTYQPVVMPDYYVNQIVLTLGTTGAGKTITLRRFFQRAIHKGYPLIIIDGKPTDENVHKVQELAKKYNRKFYGFNCGNFSYYNALSHGGYTELKDKVITLKDKWENDYYLTIAEDYLQTSIEVLIKCNKKLDLKSVASCLDFNILVNYIRAVNDQALAEKVKNLAHYTRETLTGLQAHFNMLINSELGEYLTYHPEAFNLKSVINENAVAYFALPALKFPSFAKTLGKLVINDIKSVIEPLKENKPIFTIFDEFSIFAGEQVLNLINMGRGKGMYAIFGTQGLADLRKINPEFQDQLLNCVNTLICHRLNDPESAKAISDWIGTKDSYDISAQVCLNQNGNIMGSVNKNKAFIIHPELIKNDLLVGESFYVSKIKGVVTHKIKIKN